MFPAVRDWSEAMMTSLAGGLAMVIGAIPKVLAFAVILVLGWLIAAAIGRVASSLLHAIKFNDLADRSGFAAFVRNIGVKGDASDFLAMLAKWFIRLIALVVAFDALGLPAVSDVLRQLLLWLPNLAVGIVVLVIGGLLASGAAGIVRGTTASAGFSHPDALANATRAAVWMFAIIVAVNQIGIAQELVNTLFMGAVALVVIALGLSFGLGGRDVAASLLRNWYAQGRSSMPKIQGAAERTGEQVERRVLGDRRTYPGGGGPAVHGLRQKLGD